MKPGRDPVPVRPEQVVDGKTAYTGDARPLGYLSAGAVSPRSPGQKFGNARVAFTNGVLSTQWMSRALEKRWNQLGEHSCKIQAELQRPGSKIRAYLHGEVPDVLTSLFARARTEGGNVGSPSTNSAMMYCAMPSSTPRTCRSHPFELGEGRRHRSLGRRQCAIPQTTARRRSSTDEPAVQQQPHRPQQVCRLPRRARQAPGRNDRQHQLDGDGHMRAVEQCLRAR